MAEAQKVFSRRTLGKFEDASASIPLRQLNRAFEAVDIRLGKDPGGPAGTRRTQFRRYVAGVNQHDPQQLDRLADALGALIKEVAASKEDFLVKAAESDGFLYVEGVFKPAKTSASSFGVTRVEDLAFIDDHGRRLQLLASNSPKDAIAGARQLVASVCRTLVRLTGEPDPKKTAGLVDIAKSTLKSLKLAPAGIDATCLLQLAALVASLGELRNFSPRHARLAVGAATAFAGFVAETFLEQAASKNG